MFQLQRNTTVIRMLPLLVLLALVGAQPGAANVVASASATPLPIVNVVKGTDGTSAAASVWSKSKSSRFVGLPRAASVAQRTLYFSEQLLDPTNPNSPTNFYITQDGMTPETYTMGQAPNIVVHSGTVETWIVQNHAREDHIFHIHQIHFQVLAVNGVAVNDTAIRDTYDLPYWTGQGPYPSITLAMDFRDPVTETSASGTAPYAVNITVPVTVQ